MAFSKMAFDPSDGLKDTNHYPTTPESEAQARAQVQSVSDQLRDYLNNTLTAQLENAETGQSGAESIGSAAIENVSGQTVRAQITDIKAQIDAVVAGSVTDGSITEAKLASDAVTQPKIAAGAVSEEKLAVSAVSAQKLADGAVTQPKLAAGAVSEEKLADGAVSAAKMAAGAVTETRLSSGAVTATKIAAGAVTKPKLSADALAWTLVLDSGVLSTSGSISMASQAGKTEMMIQFRDADGLVVYASIVAPLNAQGVTIPNWHAATSYDPYDYKCDSRSVVVGTSSISYTISRAESLNGETRLKRILIFTR